VKKKRLRKERFKKMKKILGIIVLSLLLSGCSDDYSKIESCASSETLRAYPDEGIQLTMNKSLRKKLEDPRFKRNFDYCENLFNSNPKKFKALYPYLR